MKLAENIKKYREIKGLSQSELAEKINVTQKSVSQYETGQQIPNIITGANIAETLGTTVENLVKGGENNAD